MGEMFDGAEAFDQDLCHFGDNFSQISDKGFMFRNSGCAEDGDPTSANGPWCAVANCLGVLNSENLCAAKKNGRIDKLDVIVNTEKNDVLLGPLVLDY